LAVIYVQFLLNNLPVRTREDQYHRGAKQRLQFCHDVLILVPFALVIILQWLWWAIEWDDIQENAETFRSVGFTDEIIAAFPNLLNVVETGSSFADFQLYRGANHPNPQTPLGRIPDEPRTDLIPMLGFPNYVDSMHTLFPLSVAQDNLEEMAQSLAVDVLSFPGAGVIYAMGGAIPFADDQRQPIKHNWSRCLESLPFCDCFILLVVVAVTKY
jgi:hypothetical protein